MATDTISAFETILAKVRETALRVRDQAKSADFLNRLGSFEPLWAAAIAKARQAEADVNAALTAWHNFNNAEAERLAVEEQRKAEAAKQEAEAAAIAKSAAGVLEATLTERKKEFDRACDGFVELQQQLRPIDDEIFNVIIGEAEQRGVQVDNTLKVA